MLFYAYFCVFCVFCALDGGKEVLSMHQVLLYLLRSSKPLVPEEEIADMLQWEELEWQKYAEECKGMIVTNPGMVRPPCGCYGARRPCLLSQGQTGIRLLLFTWDASNLTNYSQGRSLSSTPVEAEAFMSR